jgi:uncharacterized protein YjbI with pentapeptide repeats
LFRARLDRARLGADDGRIPVVLNLANMREASLVDADLRGVSLRDVNLHHADLTRADLEGAQLLGAVLRHADVTDANFDRVALVTVNITFANFSKAKNALVPAFKQNVR